MDQKERTAVLGLLMAALALCLCAYALAETQRRELVLGAVVDLARYRRLRRGIPETESAGGADPAGADYAWDGETA